jgi:hypothetical protein
MQQQNQAAVDQASPQRKPSRLVRAGIARRRTWRYPSSTPAIVNFDAVLGVGCRVSGRRGAWSTLTSQRARGSGVMGVGRSGLPQRTGYLGYSARMERRRSRSLGKVCRVLGGRQSVDVVLGGVSSGMTSGCMRLHGAIALRYLPAGPSSSRY